MSREMGVPAAHVVVLRAGMMLAAALESSATNTLVWLANTNVHGELKESATADVIVPVGSPVPMLKSAFQPESKLESVPNSCDACVGVE